MILIDPNVPWQGPAVILWDNVFARGVLSSVRSDPMFPAQNALGPQTYDYWRITGYGAALDVTLPSAEACDCLAVFNHDLGQGSVQVRVQSSSDGSSYTTRAQLTTVTDNSPLMMLFPPASARYWRFNLYAGSNLPSMGIVMLGKALRPPAGVQEGYQPIAGAQQVDLSSSVSLGGHFVGSRAIRRGAGTVLPLAPQPREWVENDAAGFIEHYNRGGTFAWAGSPELLRDDLAYCWRGADAASWTLSAGSEWAVGLQLPVLAYA